MERLSRLRSHLCATASHPGSAESSEDLRHVLIVGGTGLIGRSCGEHFAKEGWRVTTVSRRPVGFALPGAHTHLELDLSDKEACRAAISNLSVPITDLIYVALGTTAKDLDQSQVSAIDVMDAVSNLLRAASSLTGSTPPRAAALM